ncbi:MAG: riboflavin biosynthesis protein RibD, partial [Bacteroidales bacterium]|nr:riboflavin biosynthesis protein RibD [Bacteroidales bacterium]
MYMGNSKITWSETDRQYMQEAISLAELGRGHTSPNPLVGCVIVKDGRTIGRGYHHKYGGLHAEREALAACCEDPAGATAYVSLEP